MAIKNPESDSGLRLSVRDRTLDVLRRRIISLELSPGEALSENELAQELGVSRTPVREALILLREEGLIQVFPQIGSFVSLVDIERVRQAQFIREAIECASLVDIVIDADAMAGLRENLQSQRDAEASGNVERFFLLDEDFHRDLLQMSGHGAAWTAVNSAKAHLDRARRLSLIDSGHVAALVEEHSSVVNALSDGDHSAADASLRAHLRGVFKDIKQIREASPELFSDGSAPQASRRSVARLT